MRVSVERETSVRIFIEDANGLRSAGTGKGHVYLDQTDKAFPTIQAGRPVRYFVRQRDSETARQRDSMNKPPYKVPDMTEIEALPWNGYNVISTFSGAGGSCLGYRMAGFKVRWASEFIPAAQEVYKLNHPDSILDTRDIRQVQAEDILNAIGMQPGEVDIMDGSPPCASFSTAGKREAGWGKVKAYSDTKQRTDDLFFEYARLVTGVQPKVFVAENVSGLVKGTAKGYFLEILAALKDCGYMVTAKLLDAQWLGVPQMRQRVIFVGVRNDLVAQYGVKPSHPKPMSYQYSVRDAIPWITQVKFGGSPLNYRSSDLSSPTIMQTDAKRGESAYLSGGGWVEAETDISRYAIGDEWEKTPVGKSNERFFSLKKSAIDGVSFSVTAEGGNTSLASVTHPTEKRKFSIAELKRICAFPDDFQLVGSYAQQWERLGRAVPPVMMAAIAKTIGEDILDKCRT